MNHENSHSNNLIYLDSTNAFKIIENVSTLLNQ